MSEFLTKKETWQYALRIAAIVLLYFIFGTVGLSLDAVSGFATYFWIPTGLSLAAILILGYRYAPGVFLGALLVNVFVGAPAHVAIGIAIGNTLEAVAATFFLRKTGFHRNLSSYNDIFKIIIYGAFISTMLSASIGSLSLLMGGVVKLIAFPSTWFAWWIGDMVSDLIFAPFILFWARKPLGLGSKRKTLEFVVLILLVVFFGWIVFGGSGVGATNSQIIYLVFPLLIWAAIRFDQKVSAAVVLLFSLLAVLGITQGSGPFSGHVYDGLYFLQSFMGIIAITSMFLAAAFEETREADRRKDDFISIVSHELRTPITTIKGYSQLMQKSMKSRTETKKLLYLRRIDQQSDRLVNLTNDLLNLSRIARQTFEVKRKKFSLQELLEEVIEEMRMANKNRKIVLKGTITKDVYGDRERIEQVIVNLISNALKYSSSKKIVHVEVKATRRKVQVAIIDKGIGIDEKHGRRIFELFYRAVDGPRLPGLGIGLYFSRYIIRKHGGDMWYKSKKGQGSTFYFTLSTSASRKK